MKTIEELVIEAAKKNVQIHIIADRYGITEAKVLEILSPVKK